MYSIYADSFRNFYLFMIFMNKLMLDSSSSSLYHKRVALLKSKKQSYSIKNTPPIPNYKALWFSRYIAFTIYLDIHCIQLRNKRNISRKQKIKTQCRSSDMSGVYKRDNSVKQLSPWHQGCPYLDKQIDQSWAVIT